MKQMINPIFSSNNILNTQSNIMPNSISEIIGSMYSPSTSQENAMKQELDVQPRKEMNSNKVNIYIYITLRYILIFIYLYVYIYSVVGISYSIESAAIIDRVYPENTSYIFATVD